MTKKKEPMFSSGKLVDKRQRGYDDLDPNQSLLSVNFATTENPYLNEHYQLDPKDSES